MLVITPVTLGLESSNVTESAHNEWAVGTGYVFGDRVYVTLESDSSTERKPHEIYEALQSTTGDYPPDNATQWARVGPTDRWAMLDGRTTSVTERSSNIDLTVSVPERTNFVTFFGLQADTVRVVTRRDTTTLDDTTHNVSGTILTANIPALSFDIELDITINHATAQCAHMAVGIGIDIGALQWGARSGINDFSKQEVNEFGEVTLVKRNFANVLDTRIRIEKNPTWNVDFVRQLLQERVATPLAWDGRQGTGRDELAVFGFLNDFTIVDNNAAYSTIDIPIEGLT